MPLRVVRTWDGVNHGSHITHHGPQAVDGFTGHKVTQTDTES